MSENRDRDTTALKPPLPAESCPGTFSSRTQVDLGALSHRGKVRTNNEDHFLVTRLERSMQTLLTNLPAGHVHDRNAEVGYAMLVADGMGGAAAGEVASREAISALVELSLSTPDWHMRLDQYGATEVLRRMDQRFVKTREALIERVQSDPSLAGMGTTMTLAVSHGKDLVLAHVGNSRAYLFHQGQLHLLTRDQTLANGLAAAGAIRPQDIERHFARHVLTGAIGTSDVTPQADLLLVWLAEGDQVLLCTDGLTDLVKEEAIVEVLARPGLASDACRALVDRALERGGTDNVTVVLARYHFPKKLDG